MEERSYLFPVRGAFHDAFSRSARNNQARASAQSRFTGDRGHAEDDRRLVDRQAAEKPQLDQPALAGIDERQFLERGVQIEHVHIRRVRLRVDVLERHLRAGAAFQRPRARA